MLTSHNALLAAWRHGSVVAKADSGVERGWTVALRSKSTDELEIAVYDVIGQSFWGDGISSKDFLAKLRAAPDAKKITLRVNSVGGIVDEAKAMVNLLLERAANGVEIVATVDGLAASAASYLLTAATRVEMPANAFQMLHGVRGGVRGTAGDLEEAAALFRRMNEQLAEAYAAASERRGKKQTKSTYLELFAAGDTYLDADQAIEYGLADAKIATLKVAACLADIGELDGAPDALRAAPYVVLASTATPITKTPAAPVGRQSNQLPNNGNGDTEMKTISLAVFAAVLGMTAEQIEAAEEKDVLAAATKLKESAKAQSATVAVSGIKLVGVATEAEAEAKIKEFQAGMLQLLGSTGKATTAEAMGVLLEWKQGAEQATALTKKVATLTEETRVAKRDAAIVNQKNLPPARHEWARAQFATAEAVETFCAGMPTGFFAAINEPNGDEQTLALSVEEKQICKTLGMSEAQYLEEKKLLRKAG